MNSIDKQSQCFQEWYRQLEQRLDVIKSHTFAGMESGVENRTLPIHRWYNLKEAFSADFPGALVGYLQDRFNATIERVIDPFIGGGTTGVALAQQSIAVEGIEYNPFIHYVAETKALHDQIDQAEARKAINTLDLGVTAASKSIPRLSTFLNEKYFIQEDVRVLWSTVKQICQTYSATSPIGHFLLLGVAAAIDDVANLRKDGRALRYTAKPSRPSAESAIRSRWTDMLADLGIQSYSAPYRVHRGTAFQAAFITKGPFDLALFSPPYLNNFDYSEIYKLELWMLGFLQSRQDWRNLRRHTLRSHPSIAFEPSNTLKMGSATRDIAEQLASMERSDCLESSRTKREMHGVITGYFDDMYLVLGQLWTLLRPGGYLAYVVANSRHKSLPIATDVILSAIAERIGFKPLELLILKQRNGRTKQKTYLRETVTILQKPLQP